MTDWFDYLTPAEQTQLIEGELHGAIARASYVEGYRRITHTTPMILEAIKAFNERGDSEDVNFWSEHLVEEMGHDHVMYDDLCEIFGDTNSADRALEICPLSPPSAAMLSYFDWQVRRGNPHILMALRLFLEAFLSSMGEASDNIHQIIGPDGTKTLALHQELDEDHVGPCIGYLESRVDAADADAMHWSMNFIKDSLIDAQLWISRRVLAGHVV